MCVSSSGVQKGEHTQSTAKNTSVTRNLRSTLQLLATTPSTTSSTSSSPINITAQRRPHHAAGAVLRARQTRSGTCQWRSTPRRTATRGCSTEGGLSTHSCSLVCAGGREEREVPDLGLRGDGSRVIWAWCMRGVVCFPGDGVEKPGSRATAYAAAFATVGGIGERLEGISGCRVRQEILGRLTDCLGKTLGSFQDIGLIPWF